MRNFQSTLAGKSAGTSLMSGSDELGDDDDGDINAGADQRRVQAAITSGEPPAKRDREHHAAERSQHHQQIQTRAIGDGIGLADGRRIGGVFQARHVIDRDERGEGEQQCKHRGLISPTRP